MKTQVSTMRLLIKKAGLKCTETREKVLKCLVESRKALTIDDIFIRLKEEVNRVTIYRAAADFVKAGLIYQTDFQTGKAYFEYQEKHHHHVVCTSCGYTEHVEQCGVKNTVRVPNFETITHHTLEFFGTCSACHDKVAA